MKILIEVDYPDDLAHTTVDLSLRVLSRNRVLPITGIIIGTMRQRVGPITYEVWGPWKREHGEQ